MIGKAKNLADMVFVVMHWGTDGSTVVTDEQKSLAKTISEAGADAIIGMHSHTLQPVEWHANPDGSPDACHLFPRKSHIYAVRELYDGRRDNVLRRR